MEKSKIREQIKEKQQMVFFLNTKSPKKHYHRVQSLQDEIKELKEKLD